VVDLHTRTVTRRPRLIRWCSAYGAHDGGSAPLPKLLGLYTLPPQAVYPHPAKPDEGAVMTNDPNRPPREAGVVPIVDAPHAPFVFYEGAPAFGYTNGVVNITLSANRTIVGPNGGVINEQVVVAYLRGNLQAARNLREAIDKAILMGTPAHPA
jgi:hypothetical protein